MTEYNQGGWLAPATTVAVALHPDECLLTRASGQTEWVCRRAEHMGKPCQPTPPDVR